MKKVFKKLLTIMAVFVMVLSMVSTGFIKPAKVKEVNAEAWTVNETNSYTYYVCGSISSTYKLRIMEDNQMITQPNAGPLGIGDHRLWLEAWVIGFWNDQVTAFNYDYYEDAACTIPVTDTAKQVTVTTDASVGGSKDGPQFFMQYHANEPGYTWTPPAAFVSPTAPNLNLFPASHKLLNSGCLTNSNCSQNYTWTIPAINFAGGPVSTSYDVTVDGTVGFTYNAAGNLPAVSEPSHTTTTSAGGIDMWSGNYDYSYHATANGGQKYGFYEWTGTETTETFVIPYDITVNENVTYHEKPVLTAETLYFFAGESVPANTVFTSNNDTEYSNILRDGTGNGTADVQAESGHTNTKFTSYGGAYNGSVTIGTGGDWQSTNAQTAGKWNKPGTYTQEIIATDDDDSDPDGHETSVMRNIIVLANIDSDKQPNVTYAKPGNTFTWYINITNNKNYADTIDVTDTIPTGLTIGNISDGGSAAGQVVTWSGITVPAVSGGNPGTKVLSVQVTVNEDNGGVPWVNGQLLSNQASITNSLGTTQTPISDVPLDLGHEEKTITSTPSNPDGIHYDVGSTIKYRIDFENQDPLNPKNITITDVIPTNTTYVAGSAKAFDSTNAEITGATITPGTTITWTIPNVAAGDSGYVVFDVTVDEAAFGSYVKNSGKVVVGDDEVIINTNQTKTPISSKQSKPESGIVYQGSYITYTLGYEIPDGANGVIIEDDSLPANATYVVGSAKDQNGNTVTDAADADVFELVGGTTPTWTITGLTQGDKGTVLFKVKVNDNAIVGSNVTNQGKITYTNAGNPVGPADPTNPTNDEVNDKIKSTVNTPATGYKVGDEIEYRIDFTNTNVTNNATIVVTDKIPTGTTFVAGSEEVFDSGSNPITASMSYLGGVLTANVPNVAPGSSGYLTFKVKINEDALGTTIYNVGDYKYPGDNGDEVKIITNRLPVDVGQKKSEIDEGKLYAGGTITYTLGYEFPDQVNGVNVNAGDQLIITISDTIPANTKYVSGSATTTSGEVTLDDSGVTAGVGTLQWEINHIVTQAELDSIAANTGGHKGTLTFKVVVDDGVVAGTSITNVGGIEINNVTQGTIENKNTNPTNDVIDPDAKTTTTVGAVSVGEILPYFIEFENEEATNVSLNITDAIPAGTEYVENSIHVYQQDGVTDWNAADGNISGSYASGVVTFTGTGVVPNVPGKVYFEVKVTEAAVGQVIKNKADITIGNNTYKTNMLKTPTDEQKASKVDAADGVLLPGQTITYTVGYYNDVTYGVDQNITIEDLIPTSTTYVPGSATPTSGDITLDETGITAGVGTLKWTVANVPYGEGGTVTFKVTVDGTVASGEEIKNAADITVGPNAPFTTNETIDIVKPKKSENAAGNPFTTIQIGDVITYTVKYANGHVKPYDIIITDVIPAKTQLVSIPTGAVGYDSTGTVTTVAANVAKLEWTITAVPGGTIDEVTFDVTVVGGVDGDKVENTASIKVGPNDPQQTNKDVNKFPDPKPNPKQGPWLVTYLDCNGKTVKVEWVGDGYNSTKPNGSYSDVNNVHFHYTAYPNNCSVKYRSPNTSVNTNMWIYIVAMLVTFGGIGLIGYRLKKKGNR